MKRLWLTATVVNSALFAWAIWQLFFAVGRVNAAALLSPLILYGALWVYRGYL